MHQELFLPLLRVIDLRYRPIQLLPLVLAASIDFFLLLVGQFVVNFFGDLEFEVDGDVRGGTGH